MEWIYYFCQKLWNTNVFGTILNGISPSVETKAAYVSMKYNNKNRKDLIEGYILKMHGLIDRPKTNIYISTHVL